MGRVGQPCAAAAPVRAIDAATTEIILLNMMPSMKSDGKFSYHFTWRDGAKHASKARPRPRSQ